MSHSRWKVIVLILAVWGFSLVKAEGKDARETKSVDEFPMENRVESLNRIDNQTEDLFRQIVEAPVQSYRSLAAIHGSEIKFRLPVQADLEGEEGRGLSESEILHKSYLLDLPNADAGRALHDPAWFIGVGGGLLLLKDMTEEGLTLVVCHEIGHLFGGFPFVREGFTGLLLPLSVEGQADYFAAQVCLKRLWSGVDNSRNRQGVEYRAAIEAPAANLCERSYLRRNEQQLCYKIIYAAQSFVLSLGSAEEVARPPSVETPEQTEVDATWGLHPMAQCRYDTFVAAALCPTRLSGSSRTYHESSQDAVWYDETRIPGFDLELPGGPQALEQSMAATCRSDFFPRGARPRCWFQPSETVFGAWLNLSVPQSGTPRHKLGSPEPTPRR